MKILCITDQFENSNHSSIEGLFGTHLKELYEIYVVYFSKSSENSNINENKIYIPFVKKRKNICNEINKLINLKNIDIVIVRNHFFMLRNFLKNKKKYKFRIGFWNSFPHTYRRLFEAKEEKKAVIRKNIEYAIKTYFEKRLIKKCDFLIVMSKEFKDTFYSEITIPYLSLPMGVNFENLPSYHPDSNPIKKLIYTGTVDHLRKTDLIAKTFSELKEDFVLDIYTQSDNETTMRIKKLGDNRINIRPALPRKELFQKMATYDIGIGLIPNNKLYRVSSPTKTLEYYSIGLPAIINYLPEYLSLFDGECAFFCDFTKKSIYETAKKALATPKEKLYEMGRKGMNIVKNQRDYRILSKKLHNFLKNI